MDRPDGHAARAIEALYAAHFARLVRLATRWLGDPDAAEDVAQETLTAAYATLRRGEPIARPGAWLTRAARNLAVSRLRRRARRRRLEAMVGPDAKSAPADRADPAELIERRERLDEVLAALLALPPRRRDDLLLGVRAAGPAQAAAVRGVSRAAWQARLARAREALRLALAPPAADGPGRPRSVADRRRAVAALGADGRRPAEIARALGLPRRTVVSDLAVLRRPSAAVALLRQLLLFGDAPPANCTARPPAPATRATPGAGDHGPRRASGRRRRERALADQLALPPLSSDAGGRVPPAPPPAPHRRTPS